MDLRGGFHAFGHVVARLQVRTTLVGHYLNSVGRPRITDTNLTVVRVPVPPTSAMHRSWIRNTILQIEGRITQLALQLHFNALGFRLIDGALLSQGGEASNPPWGLIKLSFFAFWSVCGSALQLRLLASAHCGFIPRPFFSRTRWAVMRVSAGVELLLFWRDVARDSCGLYYGH